jgi:Wzt C-terminal domain/Sulfotransferase family
MTDSHQSAALPPQFDRWIFDHLTRTAGTSLLATLSAVLGAAALRQIANGSSVELAEELLNGAVRITAGHLAFPPGHRLKAQIGYFTFLRDPIDRAMSVYAHARRGPPLPGTYVDEAKALSFDDFVECGSANVQDMISNYYTRHFAAPVLEAGSLEDRALRRLSQYSFVGLFEEFEEALLLFHAVNGWTPLTTIPTLNVAEADRPRLSAAVRNRLTDLNRSDIALYKHARSQYTACLHGFLRLAAHVPSSARSADPALLRASEVPTPTAILEPPPDLMRFGNGQVTIIVAETFQGEQPTAYFAAGDTLTIRVSLFSHIAADDVTVGISIRDVQGRVLFGTNLAMSGQSFSVEPLREYQCEFAIGLNLGAGDYAVQAAVHTGIEHTANCFDWVDPAVKFAVAGFRGAPFVGVTGLACTAQVRNGNGNQRLSSFAGGLSIEDSAVDPKRVLVRNDGIEVWPCNGTLAVHLSYRWIDADGKVIPIEGKRFNLPAPVEPGATAAVAFAYSEPPPDAARLRLTLVQELVAWFDDVGGPTLDLPVVRGTRAAAALLRNEDGTSPR